MLLHCIALDEELKWRCAAVNACTAHWGAADGHA